MAEVGPCGKGEEQFIVGKRPLLSLSQTCGVVGDVHAPEFRVGSAIGDDHVVAAIGGGDERAVIATEGPEVIWRRGNGAVGVIKFPTHARASGDTDPHIIFIADEVLPIRREARVAI